MPDFRKVASLDEVPEGGIKSVELDGTDLILTRVEGQVYCIDNLCSHDDGPLAEGCMEGFEILCPRHEGRFDVRTGKATKWPAVWAINSYSVRVEGDDVEVSVKP
jgi:3-phenylpropionate/trans-cinnamate dioxygenase ferredoxin subunit